MIGVVSALVLLASGGLEAASFAHSGWDRVLKQYVNQIGEVDYAALKANRAGLDRYVMLLGESSPDNHPELFPSRAHQLAYWLNAYNAFVIRGVVDNYPTRSVRDLGALYGFFRRKDFTSGGVKMSLLHLENEILRKKFADPRIHFAIVCASMSCPFLPRDAFAGENLEAQLDRAARLFINQRRNLFINPSANEVTLSGLFDIQDYKRDFEAPSGPGGPSQTLLDYIRRYASQENRRALEKLKHPKIKYFDYDWSINEPGSRAKAKSRLERELASST